MSFKSVSNMFQFDLDLDSNDEPSAVRCSVERLQDTGIYLLGECLCWRKVPVTCYLCFIVFDELVVNHSIVKKQQKIYA